MSKYITGLLCTLFLLNGCGLETKKAQLYTVEIRDMKFIPEELTVHKGDTVRWINQDIVAHDVTEEGSKAWTSSVIPSGESWQMVIADTANYYCSIHVVMKGKIRMDE